MKFYDRKDESDELERVRNLCDKGTHFTVISGRRRVGKTSLVKHFSEGKKSLYFFIGRKKLSLLLEELSLIVANEIDNFPTFVRFDEFLRFLLNNIDKKTIIFFDEFQNFRFVDESVFSDFQKVLDGNKEKTRAHIIAAGSHATLMNKIFKDDKEPLFGRATENYNLMPLKFGSVSEMLEDIGIKDMEEKMKWYFVFGGMPKYYAVAEEQGITGQDIFSALRLLIFRDFAPLMQESRSILIEEFGSEHVSYFSILEAVALGNSEMTTIANKSGINIKSISKYLSLLVKDFGYLSYEVPVTEKKPWKSKRGRYFLSDNFFRFWFRYIYRNRSEYEIGNYDALLDKVRIDINSFFGRGFERICKEFLIGMNKNESGFNKIGRWWQRDKEIDIVGLKEDSGEIAFFECKWKELNEKEAETILDETKDKSNHVKWGGEERKEVFGIFAKKIEGKRKLRQEGYMAFDFEDFEKLIK